MNRPDTLGGRAGGDAAQALARLARAFGVGEESQTAAQFSAMALAHYQRAVFRRSVADQFAGLAATWREETEFTSSLVELVLHPAYQRIIGLGPAVIPLVLQELAYRPDHWFAALYALTGVDPVDRASAGDVRAMADAWLRWGQDESLIE